jgi:hypothetical protein
LFSQGLEKSICEVQNFYHIKVVIHTGFVKNNSYEGVEKILIAQQTVTGHFD